MPPQLLQGIISGVFSPINSLIQGAYAKSMQKKGYKYQKDLMNLQQQQARELLKEQRKNMLLASLFQKPEQKRNAFVGLGIIIIIAIILWVIFKK